VNHEKYPRQNIHRPAQDQNSGNAWAWKARIEGDANGALSGVTFCLKDNISVAGVPMLLGTDMFTGYTPDVDASMFLLPTFSP
jgi:amidase